MKTNFRSDTVSSLAPAILEAFLDAGREDGLPYGADRWTAELQRTAEAAFGHPLEIFPIVTGTAANALALACVSGPADAVVCARDAHIKTREAGACEYHSGGARLVELDAENGRIAPDELSRALSRWDTGRHGYPRVLSLTQATEKGTVYPLDWFDDLVAIARHHGLKVHVDGARVAHSLARLEAPMDRLGGHHGVDILSLGTSKNGTMAADAIVFFDQALVEGFQRRRKRAGHTVAKMRFLSAQISAFLRDELWRSLADQANRMAARLAAGIEPVPGVRIMYPVEINLIFARLPGPVAAGLHAAGYQMADRGGGLYRLVTDFATTEADVDRFVEAARGAAERD